MIFHCFFLLSNMKNFNERLLNVLSKITKSGTQNYNKFSIKRSGGFVGDAYEHFNIYVNNIEVVSLRYDNVYSECGDCEYVLSFGETINSEAKILVKKELEKIILYEEKIIKENKEKKELEDRLLKKKIYDEHSRIVISKLSK